jgi:hypothetical protein
MFRLQYRVFGRSDAGGGALGCLPDDLYREVAYIAYHFHWGKKDIMDMAHYERKKWISEIARINKQLNDNLQKQLKQNEKKPDPHYSQF